MGLLKFFFSKDHNGLLMTQPRKSWIGSQILSPLFAGQMEPFTLNHWGLSFLLHSMGLMLCAWKVMVGIRHPSSCAWYVWRRRGGEGEW